MSENLPDGWHEIRSVMHPIPLYDIINIEQKNEGITLKCNKPYIPTDHRNLIYKAAKLFFDETGIKKGVNITLEKYIPVGAGLGGGSSNAAATLLALNSIFKTGISTQKLSELGAKIGADVPFFIANQTQLAEGIGEKLTILPPLPCCYLVLVIPAFSIRTKLAYSQVAGLNMPCTTNKMIEALKKGI